MSTASRVGAGLALLLTACGRGASVTLDAPQQLESSTSRGAAPMFAVAPTGARTIGWISAADTNGAGELYTATDGAAPGALRDTLGGIEAHGEAPPKLTYGDDGALYALYVVAKPVPGRRFPFSTLRIAASRDGGRSWSVPATVATDSVSGSRNFHALHAGRDGALYVTWLEARGDSGSHTYLTRSIDGGRTWTPSVRVSPVESCPCCRTAIATARDGTLYVAWRTVLPGNVRDVVVASSHDHGMSWGPQVRVHEDNFAFEGCPHAGPSILVDDTGTLHVAWWTGRTGAAGVYYASSADGGRRFSAPVPLGVAAFSRPSHVQLALGHAGTVIAVWDDARSKTPRVTLRVSRDGGASFGDSVWVSTAGVAAAFPVIALRDGQFTVAWSQQSPQAMERAEHDMPNMRDPRAVMPVPTVGNQQVFVRRGRLTDER